MYRPLRTLSLMLKNFPGLKGGSVSVYIVLFTKQRVEEKEGRGQEGEEYEQIPLGSSMGLCGRCASSVVRSVSLVACPAGWFIRHRVSTSTMARRRS